MPCIACYVSPTNTEIHGRMAVVPLRLVGNDRIIGATLEAEHWLTCEDGAAN